MAEVDFGDSELFEQLDDLAPTAPTHIRFTSDDEDREEKSLVGGLPDTSDDSVRRLVEENILVSKCVLACCCSTC